MKRQSRQKALSHLKRYDEITIEDQKEDKSKGADDSGVMRLNWSNNVDAFILSETQETWKRQKFGNEMNREFF